MDFKRLFCSETRSGIKVSLCLSIEKKEESKYVREQIRLNFKKRLKRRSEEFQIRQEIKNSKKI